MAMEAKIPTLSPTVPVFAGPRTRSSDVRGQEKRHPSSRTQNWLFLCPPVPFGPRRLGDGGLLGEGHPFAQSSESDVLCIFFRHTLPDTPRDKALPAL